VIAIVVYAVVIYVVGRLNLGLSVANFQSALIAGAVIAVVAWLLNWLLVDVLNITFGGGFLGAILNLIVAAVVLMIADRFVAGMSVSGFVGALIAAIAIAVVAWLIGLLLPIDANPTTALLLRALF
jgi:putative membrane protein